MLRKPFITSVTGNMAAWRICLKLAEQGSFSRVAQSIGTDAAYVSKTISRLEKEIGFRLFARTTHSLTLTAEGKALMPRIEALAEAHDVMMSCARHGAELSDVIHVVSPALFLQSLLSVWAGEFIQIHPKVRFDLRISDSTPKPELKGVDIALHTGSAVTANDYSIPLGTQSTYVAAAPGYLKQHGSPQTPEDLKNHRLISCNGKMISGAYYLTDGSKVLPLDLTPSIEAESTSIVESLALSGFGILLHSYDYFFGKFIENNQLVRILPEWEVPSLITSLQISPSGMERPAVQKFIEFIRMKWNQTPGLLPYEKTKLRWMARVR